jgi:hypothetical protein
MTVYCTYCSTNKNTSESPLPAIDLYKSERIKSVLELSKKDSAGFVILSGKYGLIDAEEIIEAYDHLLVATEVGKHAEKVANQMKLRELEEIVFYMNAVENDKNLLPYLDCISSACNSIGVILHIKEATSID